MIFISHSIRDKQDARQLALHLSLGGGHVWLDEGNISAGDNLDEKILRAIEGSSVFLYLVSEFSLASSWVQKELKHAIRCKVAIIALLLEESTFDQLHFSMRSNAALRISDGYPIVASKVLEVEAASERIRPGSLQVWLRDEMFLQHSLDRLIGEGINVGSAHLLTSEYGNLVDELHAAGDPDLSWLDNGGSEQATVLRAWVSNLPRRVNQVVAVVPRIAQTYVSAGSGSTRDTFLRNAAEESILALIRHLTRALERVRHLAEPSVASDEEIRRILADMPTPFEGGLTADVAWGSIRKDYVVANCPKYVENKDLMPGLVRAELIVTPDDLGRMIGSCLAQRSWIQAGNARSTRLVLDAPFPELSELMIGPH